MGDPGETDLSGQITHTRCESGVLRCLRAPCAGPQGVGSMANEDVVDRALTRCRAESGVVSLAPAVPG